MDTDKQEQAKKPLRLLIIEDSEDDALLVIRHLEKAGFELNPEIVDGAEPLGRALDREPWDLFISDFSLPHFNGMKALQLVREKGSDAPFIFLSGTIGEDTAVEAMRQGANDYLMKGNIKRLIPAIRRELYEFEVRKTNRKLEAHLHQIERFETIGRLAGGIAHDFNNLIGVIMALSELGKDDVPEGGTAFGRFEEIGVQARRAADLTRQLLAFARRQILEPKILQLNAIVAGTTSLLQKLLGHNVELKLILAPELRATCADPTQIEQVLMNLVINAKDAMPKGGQLVIETTNVDLDAGFTSQHGYGRQGSFVLLAVSDTGTGMDAATLERIFEPFFTTKDLGQGTGLGLATVYGIVKQHQGFINVYSEVEHGSIFRIYLPAVVGKPEELPVKEGASAQGGAETILVAEDNESLREVAREMLSRLGYKLILARDGEEAIRLFEQHQEQLDLIVLDMVMPRKNGSEVYEHIARLKPQIPVIFTTGYSPEASLVNHSVPPGVSVLQKPYPFSSLTERIRVLLDRRKRSS